MKSHVLMAVALFLLLWLLAGLGSIWGAGATYTVYSTRHTYDGSCDVLGATTDCTLWEAINLANANGGTDTIAFDIPITDTNYGHNTPGVWSIVLTGTLPSLAGEIVDCTTQATNYLSDTNPYGPEIEISGESLGPGVTCWSVGSGGTIEGLAINRCPSYGLYISGDGNTIIGNYIGTDATGSADVSTTYDGILLTNGSENNNIGGPGEEERNVISGNNGAIRMFGASTTGNVIQGNYIGTDRTGASALANNYGIKIESGAHDNTVGHNNVIAYNSSDGIVVDGGTTTGNTITQNSIHSNGTLGISLTYGGNDSVAPPVISFNTCVSARGTPPSTPPWSCSPGATTKERRT